LIEVLMNRIEIDGKEILVRPPKNPSDEVKQTLGGRWDKTRKCWRVQPTAMNVIQLVDWYGEVILDGAPDPVADLFDEPWGFPPNEELVERARRHPAYPDLYKFQQEAVEYMVSNPHRGSLLALEPGLGKTPVSAVAADVLEAYRILIVAPLTLARNWIAEFETWSEQYRSWSRATRSAKDPMTECVVTNHEVLFEPHFFDEYGERVEVPGGPAKQKKWILEGPKVHDKKKDREVPARKRKVEVRSSYDRDWDIILVDESILLKNRRAVKVDILEDLVPYAKQVWLLSGSPTAKFRTDLWPQVKLIMPRGFTSYWRFAEFFCVIDKNQWGWKIAGDRPDHDPRVYLKDFLFLRSQKEVLPDLPEYIYDPIEIDLNGDQQRAFTQMSEDWVVELGANEMDQGHVGVSAPNTIAQMNRLAQITSNMINIGGNSSSAKEDLLMELIKYEDIQFPLLVWCWWVPTATSVFDRLYKETDLAVDVVYGAMTSEEKDEALDAYKQGRTDVLVLQMGVGKFGHTFTETRTVYYHDRHFDSDAYFQSLRRVRRIGLDHRPRLIVPRSLRSSDPAVELNLSGKLQSIARLGNRDLKELLQSLGSGNVPWEDPL
jgi:SNF2 family DNA or RNA helicase